MVKMTTELIHQNLTSGGATANRIKHVFWGDNWKSTEISFQEKTGIRNTLCSIPYHM
jgi:hypothetical protein